MSTIESRVKEIVAEQLNVILEEVANSSRFVHDLGADGIEFAELIMAFEEEYDIKIPDEKSEDLTTVQSAIDYITAHKP